jgi:hypothetical protein
MQITQILEYPDFTLTVKPNPNRVIFHQRRYLIDDDTARTAWRALLQTIGDDTLFLVHDVSLLTVDPPNKSVYLRLGLPFVTVMCFLNPRLSFIRVTPRKPPTIWAEWELMEVQCLSDGRQVRHFTSMKAAEHYVFNSEHHELLPASSAAS